MRLNILNDSSTGSFSDRLRDEINGIPQKRNCCRRIFAQTTGTPGTRTDGLLCCPQCAGAYLRALFLACGSLNSPEKEYYLQFSPDSDTDAENIRVSLAELGLRMSLTHRKGKPVLYTKSSGTIEDFLAAAEAQNTLFEHINAKIKKELRNNANRVTNCETKNIEKSVGAAQQQLAAIRKLEKRGMLSSLPEELAVAASLRLENPQASLGDLAAMSNPPVSRSGMNHRLSKLIEAADKL